MASKYKFLFRVPGSGYASLILMITGLGVGLLQSVIAHLDPHYSALSGVLALGAAPVVVNIFSKALILRRFRVASFRRLNHLSLLENYFFLAAAGIGALIGYFEGSAQVYVSLICSALSLSIFLRSTVLSTFTHDSLGRGFLSGLLEPALRGVLLALLAPSLYSAPPIFSSTIIGAALAIIALMALLRPIKEDVSPLHLAGGFVAAFLVGDGSYLEGMLEKLSSEFSGVSEAFLFRRTDGRKLAIVVTPYHLGPFRNIGSSMLNAYIENELQQRGIDAVVLKGCTGHEANLVSSNESRKICREIVKHICNDASAFTDTICLYAPTRHGRVSVLGMELDGKHVLIPTLHPEPMEDLPPEVSHFASHYNAVVIDPHNSYSEKFSGLTEEDVKSIKEAIPLALSSSRTCGKFSVGLARIVPTNYGLSDGLGVGGFSLLGLAVSDMRVALAVIDGNNALPSVRDSVIERLRKEGWTAAELLTTDTHMVNGVSLGGKGYYAVGEKITPSEVSEIFAELSKAVQADMRGAEVKYVKIRHEYSKIFSEDLLERLAKKSSHLLIIYLLLTVLSLVLPPIIF
jgi:putative membrane protein